MSSAAATVSAIPELLEQILIESMSDVLSKPSNSFWDDLDTDDVRDMFRNQEITRTFAGVIASSPALKRAMGTAHDPKADKMDVAMRNSALIRRAQKAMRDKFGHVWSMLVHTSRPRDSVPDSAGSPFEKLQALLPIDGPAVMPTAFWRQVRVDSIVHDPVGKLAVDLVSSLGTMHIWLTTDCLTAGEVFDAMHAFSWLGDDEKVAVQAKMKQAVGAKLLAPGSP